MKNKVIVLCACIGVLGLSFWASTVEEGLENNRYHEHLVKETKYPNYDYSKIDETTFQSRTIDPSSFSSHLPIISFDTEGKEILGGDDKSVDEYIQSTMKVYDNSGDNALNSKETFKTETLIRYRGNSSRSFDKKGLRVKLINKKGEDREYPLLGLSEDSDFILHGPWLDKTLMRNYIGYNLTGEFMEYSPNVRFCEVFVNKEYQGVYLLVEKIKVDKNKIDISKLNKNADITSYLLVITKRYVEDDDLFYLDNFSRYTNRIVPFSEYNIVYPSKTKMTTKLNKYINDDLSYFERILYSFDYDDENFGYANHIDIDSFVNYVVFNEFFLNFDAGNNSTYIYKDKTGKMKLAFWDMNNIFDNYFVDMLDNQEFLMKDKNWFQMLLKDEYFTERVIARYREMRKNVLSDDYLYEYIDEVVDYLGPAIERNFVKYGDSFSDEKNRYVNVEDNAHSYKEAIDDMKTAIRERGKWLDENIESLRQFSHASKVKDYNP